MNFKYWNRGRVLNVKKIIAVKNATYAVAKKIPEKTFQACRESGTPTSAIPLQRSNQMSYEIKIEPQAFHIWSLLTGDCRISEGRTLTVRNDLVF